jgi:hypothetical protein
MAYEVDNPPLIPEQYKTTQYNSSYEWMNVAQDPYQSTAPTRTAPTLDPYKATFTGSTPEEQAYSRQLAQDRMFNKQLDSAFRSVSGGFAFPLGPGAVLRQHLPGRAAGSAGTWRVIARNRQPLAGAGVQPGAGGAPGGAVGGGGDAGGAFLAEWRKDIEEANARTEADRQRLLAAIDEFKGQQAGFSEMDMSRMTGELRQSEEAKNREIMRQTQERFASMGRVASPITLGQIQKRLAIQSADLIANRRVALEMESAGMKLRAREFALSSLQETLAGTQRDVIDPGTALQVMQLLGRGTSQVAPYQV